MKTLSEARYEVPMRIALVPVAAIGTALLALAIWDRASSGAWRRNPPDLWAALLLCFTPWFCQDPRPVYLHWYLAR